MLALANCPSDAINRVYSGAYTPVRHGQKSAHAMMTEIKPQIEELLRG